MTLQGKESNVTHFEWNEEYQDFTNRFEQWVELQDIKLDDTQNLYNTLSDWLGITKKGRKLPSQTQMDFFSEYYGADYFDVSSYEREQKELYKDEDLVYEYKSGSLYNERTGEFRRHTKDKYEYYNVMEKTFHYKYGDRRVLIDTRTKRILAHHYDAKSNKYLGSQV